MRTISKRRLREFWEKHPDARMPLLVWWKRTEAADWSSIQDVRRDFPHADAVGLRNGDTLTIFNIGGNKYRLAAQIIFPYRRVYVRKVMTHAE